MNTPYRRWEKSFLIGGGLAVGFVCGLMANRWVSSSGGVSLKPEHIVGKSLIIDPRANVDYRHSREGRPELADAVQKPDANVIRISRTVAELLNSKIVIDAEGKLHVSSLASYGVPYEKWADIKVIVEDTLAKIKALTLENSELRTMNNGEQYFRLKPFAAKGEILRQECLQRIKQALGDTGDDLAELLCMALSRNSEIGGFGEKSTELWFEEVKGDNGEVELKAYEKVRAGSVVEPRPVTSPRSMEVLSQLIEMHVAKNKP